MLFVVKQIIMKLFVLKAEEIYMNSEPSCQQPFKDQMDDFFESVMVNAENPTERLNRLRLLGALRALFTQLADLALLSSGSE